jgi:hypothetical protein
MDEFQLLPAYGPVHGGERNRFVHSCLASAANAALLPWVARIPGLHKGPSRSGDRPASEPAHTVCDAADGIVRNADLSWRLGTMLDLLHEVGYARYDQHGVAHLDPDLVAGR